MDGHEDFWTELWECKTDEFLEGYCFADDSVFYEHNYEFSQHHSEEEGLVYYWEDEE